MLMVYLYWCFCFDERKVGCSCVEYINGGMRQLGVFRRRFSNCHPRLLSAECVEGQDDVSGRNSR